MTKEIFEYIVLGLCIPPLLLVVLIMWKLPILIKWSKENDHEDTHL